MFGLFKALVLASVNKLESELKKSRLQIKLGGGGG
jgi:hypothetical protein